MPDQKQLAKQYANWVDALMVAMEASLRAEDPSNVWKHGGYKQYARRYEALLTHITANLQLPPLFDRYNLDAIRGGGDTVAFQQKEIFENVYANAAVLRAHLRALAGVEEDERRALEEFIQARLRAAMFEAPSHERDVQNALESLFIGRGLVKGQDYDREVGRVKVSAKEFVPDFVFPKLRLAVEAKLSTDVRRMKAIVDEIAADTVGYGGQYPHLTFVIYDLGSIRDELEFRRDLEAISGVSVLIIKH